MCNLVLVSVILVGVGGGGGGGGVVAGQGVQFGNIKCGQREGLNQYPKPLDHHALTK